jgi:hypothetical protein
MSAAQARTVLLANAAFDFGAGLLMLAGSWDGLWDALDLPQGRPATFVQIGGAGLLGLAYVMWRAADQPPLRAPVAFGAALADGLAAVIIVVWLISGNLDFLGGLGTALLIAIVVVLGAFSALKFRIASERPSSEEFTRSR